jgi:VWFA-related protein
VRRWLSAVSWIGFLAVQTNLHQTSETAPAAVAVYATVCDAAGRPVDKLTQSDFQILDDGAPAAVTVFSADPLPLSGVFLIDMSETVLKDYPAVKTAALHVIDRLAPGDRLRVGSFGLEVTFSPLLTGDKAVLGRVIDEELWPGGSNPFWLAARRAMESFGAGKDRRVVIVLTSRVSARNPSDCPQSGVSRQNSPEPCANASDTWQQAERDNALFYTVGLEGQPIADDVATLASASGGAAFDVKHNADLNATLDQVLDELRHQYVLGFVPARADGKSHRLEVSVNKTGMIVRARQSYRAEVPK